VAVLVADAGHCLCVSSYCGSSSGGDGVRVGFIVGAGTCVDVAVCVGVNVVAAVVITIIIF
jgi:hypothetical protein